MTYNEHCHFSFLFQFSYYIKNFFYKFRIQCRSGLIKQKNIRFQRQSSCYCNPLFLTSAQFIRKIIFLIGKSDCFQYFFCNFLSFFHSCFLYYPQCFYNIVLHRHMWKKIKILEYHSCFQ